MKRITALAGIFLFLTLSTETVSAQINIADDSAQLKVDQKKPDNRVTILKDYLNSHHSPLAPFAKTFVVKADLYRLPDWRLVPAISGVESTFGKRIPYNSYNAYGWANGNYSFLNWEQSIDIVTRTLKEKYYNRGLGTVEQIGRVYAPPSSTWAAKVRFFMDKIENHLPPQSLAMTL